MGMPVSSSDAIYQAIMTLSCPTPAPSQEFPGTRNRARGRILVGARMASLLIDDSG